MFLASFVFMRRKFFVFYATNPSLPAPIYALGENPRSLGQAVSALLCHALLEDTVLESMMGSSLMVVADGVGSSFF
jgi:hypothetical protein